jgi:hypothetical protein
MVMSAPPGPFWASWLPSRDPKLQALYFDEKLPKCFFPILFLEKTDRNGTLLETASNSVVFIPVWRDSGANL